MRIATWTCALALVVAPACTLHQARATRRTAEVVTASALVVMMATLLATSVAPGHDALHEVGLACVPLALFGAGVYIAADQRAAATDEAPVRAPPRHVDSPSERANQRARDCDDVRTLEERIAQLDSNVHEASLRYRTIRTCLGLEP